MIKTLITPSGKKLICEIVDNKIPDFAGIPGQEHQVIIKDIREGSSKSINYILKAIQFEYDLAIKEGR